jgi:hypothetical protein
MNKVLVLGDSNVLLDVATEDPRWGAWSAQALEAAADESHLVINPLIHAEVSIGFATAKRSMTRPSAGEGRAVPETPSPLPAELPDNRQKSGVRGSQEGHSVSAGGGGGIGQARAPCRIRALSCNGRAPLRMYGREVSMRGGELGRSRRFQEVCP